MTQNTNHLLKRLAWLTAVLAALGWACFHYFASSPGTSAKQPSSNPELQRRVQSSIQRASPAVVWIAGATGTIISADGLVLSQAHVTHVDYVAHKDRSDGDSVQVIFADGKETTAKLVACDRGADVSLAKIDAPGPFPYLQLSNRAPKLGDYAIKLGHPGGLHPLRGLVARLGRVVSTEPNHVAADCLTIGGDSGSPFVDLDGELLGMVSGSIGTMPGSDVPYELASALAASRLTKLIATVGTISNYRGIRTGPAAMKLTPAAELAPIVENLRKNGSRSSPLKPAVPQVNARVGHWPATKVSARTLPHCDWMSGPRHADAITDRVRSMPTTDSRVVEFHADGKLTKLGFFIDAKLVLTRASGALGEGSGFAGGKRRTAIDLTVVATNDALDLMLLKTDAPTNHAAIDWLDEAPVTGTLLAAAYTGAWHWTVGVVSVSLRTPESVDPSRDFLGRDAFYDSISPADAVFPAYLDTDLHLYVHETGQPVFDVNGLCVGIAIRASHIGARVIPAKTIRAWVETLKLGAAD